MHFISEIRYNPVIASEQKYYRIKASFSLLITRTVYPSSELKSLHVMKENSTVCEQDHGEQGIVPGYKTTYQIAPDLYKIKDKLEHHLCDKTDTYKCRRDSAQRDR